ncbi:magnesium transporter CorA family protein [Alicyclobacillus fodiniaquatilis]|uniref:Magnesium transporter CorA family protein n=1 Tax=Alicyclobacillus fodiniaquatilis TaxID=1661150 RepID=A0ABW4JID3_9BACL
MLVYRNDAVTHTNHRPVHDDEHAFLALLHPNQQEIKHVLGSMYHCHPMIIEKCLEHENRPKLNVYQNHAFFPFYFIKDDWELIEIFVVMGKNFVIAVLTEPMPFLKELEQEFEQSPEKMKDPGRILYEFLDLCVHHYLDFLDAIEDQVDDMESQVYDNPQASIASEIFSTKRKIHKIRRVFSEERTVIESLMHTSFPFTAQENYVYMTDLFDHINRIVDGIDNFREALTGLLDLQMAIKSDRMNNIMKTLTIVSTFFMPLSFIVGLYGTNVKVPEYNWRYGYVWIWAWIIASVIGLWFFFRKKKWF